MSVPIRQPSFGGGEIAPFLYARTDLSKYESSLRTMRNFMAMRHGGATKRPGTKFIGSALNGGNPVRLIPFIFNETGVGQSYVCEFGNLYIAFYQNGGVVVDGSGNPYTIASPYVQADLSTLDYDQSADIITIVHPNYPIAELSRTGPGTFSLNTSIVFQSPAGPPTNLIISYSGGAGPYNYAYWVTSVDQYGNETEIARALNGTRSAIALLATNNILSISWTASADAVSYKIYGTGPNGASPGFLSQTNLLTFTDYGVNPDFSNAGKYNPGLFSAPGDYPSHVAFIQQRRAFANTKNNPLFFSMSQPGSFYNFNYTIPSQDDDSVIGTIAGNEVNAIQSIRELKFMLVLTSGAEIFVQGNGTGVVTPSAINASAQSQYGCSTLRPIKVGDVLLFNQALGSFIRDFAFDFAIDGYRGNDIAVFAAHLFEGYQIVDWCYQKIPDSIIWAVRSDGILLSCTYVREQQVLAWARHDFTNGFVENVCAIPENGAYALYLVIRRTINGQTVRYVERMSSRLWADEINASYLDCFSMISGVNSGATTMTLVTPSGGFTSGANAYQQQIVLQASAAVFNPSMVGKVFILSDAAFASGIGSQGPDGTLTFLGDAGKQLQCFVQSYLTPTAVIITPSGEVPSTLRNVAVTTWSEAIKTVGGLSYLENQQVSVWADRYVVGSPLNKQIANVYTVDGTGSLTLDKWYSTIYVGLPMVCDLQTLDIETTFGESLLATRKRVGKIGVFTYKTRTLFAGTEDPDLNQNNTNSDPLFELYELQRGSGQVSYDDPPELTTDQDYVSLEAKWNRNGRVFVRDVDPVPSTILAISVFGENPAQSPFYVKP